MARSHVAWLSSLFLLAACRTFDVEREQAFLRYRPDADALDVVLVYDGVGAVDDTDQKVSGALDALGDIGGGGRRLMLYDWWLDFDLADAIDGARKRLQKSSDSDEADIVRAFLDYEGNIRFDAARLLTNEGGRLYLLQRLSIEHFSQGLRLLDRQVNLSLINDGDDESSTLAVERARKGGSWAHFDGTTLEISLPMTPEEAAKALVSLTQAKPPFTTLLQSLSALYVTGDEVRLRFAPAEDGWITFEFADPGRSYDPEGGKRIATKLGVTPGDLSAVLREFKAKP